MGLIEKQGKFLFGIEAKKGIHYGKWKLLGGKLEENETAEQAMIREAFEEANIKIEVKSFLGEMKGDVGNIIVQMCFAKYLSGEPKATPREIETLKWFSLEEARKLEKDTISTEALKLFEIFIQKQKSLWK